MRKRATRHLIASVALAVLWSSKATSSYVQLPQFRAGVALTRVEVRVVDSAGYPVRDLTRDEFVLREDGYEQEIAHFQAVSFDGVPELVAAPRMFLIVLGRGQLEAPTKTLRALTDFVRSKCLPADRVGVVAYLRAIEFTTNHEAVARFLETFRGRHEAIDSKIARDLKTSAMAPDTRASIDALFRDDGLQVRDLAAGAGNNVLRFSDFRFLKAALEYLSVIDGEKHAVFVTQRPFINIAQANTPAQNYWIRQATSARTTLSFIHAGGLKAEPANATKFSRPESPLGFDPGFIDDQEWMANQTGGTATFFQFGDKPLTALDRATRAHYVLGYYPSRAVSPEQYRNIEVTVKRADVRPLYRHGYVAQPRPEEPQDYRRAVTDARLTEGAFRLVDPFPTTSPAMGFKLGMTLKVPSGTSLPTQGPMPAIVSFDPSWVYFRQESAAYVAELDLRLLADDAQRKIVGEINEQLTFRLTADEFERSQRRLRPQSLTFDVVIKVKARPAHLRGVLYQFDSDRTASAQVHLK
ncbi:MAG: VWA domain-containing protein [Acidobacteriota bacterium]